MKECAIERADDQAAFLQPGLDRVIAFDVARLVQPVPQDSFCAGFFSHLKECIRAAFADDEARTSFLETGAQRREAVMQPPAAGTAASPRQTFLRRRDE